MKFLAFGSNRSYQKIKPKALIEKAYSFIEQHPIKILKKSDFYSTEPDGFLDDQLFINTVIQIESFIDIKELLKIILEIELKLGRERRNIKNLSRSMDIDILLHDNLVLNTDSLTVPHPRMWARDFVLMPLSDIVNQIENPLTGEIIDLRDYQKKEALL